MRTIRTRLADLDRVILDLDRQIKDAETDEERRHAAQAKLSAQRLRMTIRDREGAE